MERHEQVIQLSDHVKNKLKQHKHPPLTSFINSSDEFIETISTDDDNDSVIYTPSERSRRDTYTTYQVKQSSDSFFTDRKANKMTTVSVLQQQCQECLRRNHSIDVEHERLYDENQKLNEQLRSSILLNHQYEEENDKLKSYLTKMNSHLYEYQINFDHLKQKMTSEKKTSSKLDEEDKQDVTVDHLKRLRYEVQMYNRIVAAKEQQEQNKIDFFF